MKTADLAKYYRAEDYFFSAVTRRHQHFGDVASCYSTDIADQPINISIIRRALSSPTNFLQDAQAFFSESGVSFSVVIPTDLLEEASNLALHQAGFSQSEVSVAMMLPLTSAQKSNWARVQQMDARLDEWVAPLIAFGPCSLMPYRDCHEMALRRGLDLRHFSLFDNDKPVCSLTLSFGEDWVRIDDLATLPAQQRHGFARTLLCFATNFAASEGKKVAYLEASKQGLALYQQAGFVPIFENHNFVKKPPLSI